MDNDSLLDSSRRVVYTISEINQMVASLLRDSLPPLWISGELSNLACLNSGHWYFSLKDAQAYVRCAMFQGQNRLLNFQPQNGQQVLIYARISLYERRGEFQLLVEHMEPAGDGVLRLAFETLKSRLADEGLFDPQRKKTLSNLPKSIGLITSPTGAAILDILSILNKRFPAIPVFVYPTMVQGAQAVEQIITMLTLANQRRECEVLVLARGGGSLEDLWPFNTEEVARAIYASHIPVVSAVGHEIDFTISDFVADLRAATPSDAAALISPDQQEWQRLLMNYLDRLRGRLYDQVEYYQRALANLVTCLRHPSQKLQDYWQCIDRLEQRLMRSLGLQLQKKKQQLASLNRVLDTTNPLATLARGYALITRLDGHVVCTVDQVDVGTKVMVKLAQGEMLCTVDKKV